MVTALSLLFIFVAGFLLGCASTVLLLFYSIDS